MNQKKIFVPRSGLSAAGSQRGLTLVELMVALVLGLFLLAVVGTLFLGSKQTYRTQENLARMQENGRFVLDLLGRNVREAGYKIISFAPPAADTSLSAKFAASALVLSPGFAGDIAGANTNPDSITVSYDSATDCVNVAAPGGRAVNQFSINANQLVCLGNSSATAQAMLGDVEDMQILYGESAGNNRRYVAAGTAGLNMANVVSARACVLLRSADDNLATRAQTYMDCNGVNVTAADRRIRRTYTATFNLRNR